ncbi:MAG: hypothetical protein IPM22_01875 [Betaproteobacteria bacterium]|nr:hypothetical protein [Betaproteobacteria bacterium]MCC7215899.1 hypothetical protein [Burkholderiales bacterium]
MKVATSAIRRAAAVAGLALLAGACVPAGIPETVLPADITYACRRGIVLRVVRAPDGSAATVSTGDRPTRLPRMDSPIQEKYGDGATTLYLDGERAALIRDGVVVAGPCVATNPLPVGQTMQPEPAGAPPAR